MFKKRIWAFFSDLSKIKLFHVKCENNIKEDMFSNTRANLRQDEMVINNANPIIKWTSSFTF